MSSVLVVIGSGPGIGLSTASLFAKNKFAKVALVSRNAARLAEDKEAVLKAAGRDIAVSTFTQDISKTASFRKTLDSVEKLGEVSCVFFNAARVEPSDLMSYGEEETTNIGLLTTARWALPLLSKSTDKPSLLVTNSLLWDQPFPQYFSLSMVKTSQRSLVRMLQSTYPDVHIALVNIGGVVSTEDPVYNPKAIGETFWEVYEHKKAQWVSEVNIVAP